MNAIKSSVVTLLFTGRGSMEQMGLMYHAATLSPYKNAAGAKLENTLLSASVFIRATSTHQAHLFRKTTHTREKQRCHYAQLSTNQ